MACDCSPISPSTTCAAPARQRSRSLFTLDRVVPWGRGYDEYTSMFALGERALAARILGCADGPASFNAEATVRGARVVSCDPLYKFSAREIAARIEDVFAPMLAQTRANVDGFLWSRFATVEALGAARRAAMQRFLEDYRQKQSGRYVAAALPTLPFSDDAFDIALSSHFLFLYTEQLSFEFHHAAVRELCRVAREVRIFPIITLARDESRYLQPIVDAVHREGRLATLERVAYEFQRGGHTMLRIQRRDV